MVSAIRSTTRTAGIMMPTHDQLVKTYGSIIDGRQKAHALKPLKGAPHGLKNAPSYNISKGLGVGRTAYVIRGELYLKTQVVAPNAKPHWFNAGPAPLF